ncbi:MAG: hypothetical protein ABF747_04385 [Bifidobacterium sp.]|uniref:Uncharacterized protein n=1 Tax=Bifidobacterium fermentum TaxID=3059035 RepID=A0AB39UGA4_9BIFI
MTDKYKIRTIFLALLFTLLCLLALAIWLILSTQVPRLGDSIPSAPVQSEEAQTHYLRIGENAGKKGERKIVAEFHKSEQTHILSRFDIDNQSDHRYQIRLTRVGLVTDSILVDASTFSLEVNGEEFSVGRSNFGKLLEMPSLTFPIESGKSWHELYFKVLVPADLDNKYQHTSFSMYFTFEFKDLQPNDRHIIDSRRWRRMALLAIVVVSIPFALLIKRVISDMRDHSRKNSDEQDQQEESQSAESDTGTEEGTKSDADVDTAGADHDITEQQDQHFIDELQQALSSGEEEYKAEYKATSKEPKGGQHG